MSCVRLLLDRFQRVRSIGWFYFTEEFGLTPSCAAESLQYSGASSAQTRIVYFSRGTPATNFGVHQILHQNIRETVQVDLPRMALTA
jgi:hypothetical protein